VRILFFSPCAIFSNFVGFSDGVCVYPFALEQTNGDPSCPVGTAKGQLGCINYAITSAANCVNGSVAGAFWRRPASSPEECTNHGSYPVRSLYE
jgi:hypothetical protein